MLSVVVTGAGGFIGQRFMQYKADKYKLKAISLRNVDPSTLDLNGVDVIVHLSGKAHDMKLQDEQVYMDINYELTKSLAQRAIQCGVKHFVYISTVKVYGEGGDEVLTEASIARPTDPYGKSKFKAELFLHTLYEDLVVSIVRPPVVYGPGVKGNILRLMDAVIKGKTLPLGNTGNKRTIVFLDNLIELIHRVIDKRESGIFIPADEQPVSTDELIRIMSEQAGKKVKLVTIPGAFRNMMRSVKPGLHKRLFGSFVLDTKSTNRRLEFKPPYSTRYGIGEMINWYKNNLKHS